MQSVSEINAVGNAGYVGKESHSGVVTANETFNNECVSRTAGK